MQAAVGKAAANLEKVRSNILERLLTVEDAVAETKKTRESDLEIIERALVVSHSNHEKARSCLDHHTCGNHRCSLCPALSIPITGAGCDAWCSVQDTAYLKA